MNQCALSASAGTGVSACVSLEAHQDETLEGATVHADALAVETLPGGQDRRLLDVRWPQPRGQQLHDPRRVGGEIVGDPLRKVGVEDGSHGIADDRSGHVVKAVGALAIASSIAFDIAGQTQIIPAKSDAGSGVGDQPWIAARRQAIEDVDAIDGKDREMAVEDRDADSAEAKRRDIVRHQVDGEWVEADADLWRHRRGPMSKRRRRSCRAAQGRHLGSGRASSAVATISCSLRRAKSERTPMPVPHAGR